jgi:hypothetical protein
MGSAAFDRSAACAPVVSVKTAFNHAVKLAGLWGRVTPHTLRHTAATWLVQRGVPLWQAAGYLGMSAEILERTYGHHHPHHMRAAAQAITSKQVETNVSLVVSLVEQRSARAEQQKTQTNHGGSGRSATIKQDRELALSPAKTAALAEKEFSRPPSPVFANALPAMCPRLS